MKNRLRIINAAILAVAMAGGTAHAETSTWTDGGADGSYSNSDNWDTVDAPGSGDVGVINGPYTINYTAGETNSLNRGDWNGGVVLNISGGKYTAGQSGNTTRETFGNASSATVNQTGGHMNIGHLVRIGQGAAGNAAYNLSGGLFTIFRGGNTLLGNPTGASLSIGPGDAVASLNISGGTLETRVGVEMGMNATFEVNGADASIDLGVTGYGEATWFQSSNATLRVGISPSGLSPIMMEDSTHVNDTNTVPLARFEYGSILDVGFIDGAMETNSWLVMECQGTMDNQGLLFAPGVDTNNWGFVVSDNNLYVGYGLGWPAGGDVTLPPAPQRTLYWTGNGADSDANNPTNWVTDTSGTQAIWGPYDDDLWTIGSSAVSALVNTNNLVVDYNNSANSPGQRALSLGNAAEGTLNFNSGNLIFTANVSGIQTIGGGNANGKGTLNVNGGTLTLNKVRMGLSGAVGTINVNGGTFNVERGWQDGNDGFSSSIYIGYGSTGTGTVNIAGGRIFTRGPVSLGDLGGQGIFSVQGSTSSEIGIGSNGSVDGAWIQHAAGTLKVRIDEGGITPISVVEKDDNNTNDGDAYFYDGSTLDVDWMPGVTNYGSFLIMEWDGVLVESNLAFSAGVDTDMWDWEFKDSGATTNGLNQLWVKTIGGVPTVVPNITSYSISGSDLTLSWDSEPGFNYNVLSRSDLIFGNWVTNVAAVPSAGTTTTTNLTASGGPAEFYEIEAY